MTARLLRVRQLVDTIMTAGFPSDSPVYLEVGGRLYPIAAIEGVLPILPPSADDYRVVIRALDEGREL